MNNGTTIFVTGATGNQGGAVARNLIHSGFTIKALTRNANSPPAQHLKASGAEIIQGDLNLPDSFSHHLKDTSGVFSVQSFEDGTDKETQQGIALANLAKEYKVPHFLYSSVAGADQHTGIPHWESKNKIENHIQQKGLSFTIIRPTSLFENFLIPQVYSRILKGKFVSPINKEVRQQFISADDIGKISVSIFSSPDNYKGETLTLAAEEMNAAQVAATFSEVFGTTIKYQKLPKVIARLVMGKDLYKMFRWINENGGAFIKDIAAFKNEHPGLTSLKEWIKTSFKKP